MSDRNDLGMSEEARAAEKHGKKPMPLLLTLAALAALWVWEPSKGATALTAAGKYGLDLLLILPAVMILTALFNVWVPKETVERLLGGASGWKGLALSLLFGGILEGPLYVAFPIARALLDKGARIRNTVAFLTIWACAKVPQVMMEARFLGPTFAVVRVTLSVGAAAAIGWIVEAFCGGRAGGKADAVGSRGL